MISHHYRVLLRNLPYVVLALTLIFLSIDGTKKIQTFHHQTTKLTSQIHEAGTHSAEQLKWERRYSWIRQNAPSFGDQQSATEKLIKTIQNTVANHGDWNLKIVDIQPGAKTVQTDGSLNLAYVDVTVNGGERDIVAWIHSMQNPAALQGIEHLAMELGYSHLVCEARICQWFVPSK